jgi:hypothetical protein
MRLRISALFLSAVLSTVAASAQSSQATTGTVTGTSSNREERISTCGHNFLRCDREWALNAQLAPDAE